MMTKFMVLSMRNNKLLYFLILMVFLGCDTQKDVSVTSDNSYLASDMKVQIYVIIKQDEYVASGNMSTNVASNVTK